MRKLKNLTYFYILTLWIISGNSIANTEIKPFTAKYDVYRNGLLIARTVRVLSNNKDVYEFKSSTTLAGLAALFLSINIQEKSTLLLQQGGFYLHNYQYLKTDKNNSEKFSIQYNAKKNNLYHSLTRQSHTLKKQQYDTLSFVIGIMSDFIKNEPHKHYIILEKNKVRDYLLQVSGNTLFTYQGKELPTRILEQVKLPSRHQFTFWCAEKFQYLPVRIKKTEIDGDEILMKLTHYNGQAIELSSQLDEITDEEM
jgi:Protein of unknown function (DUF3108)